MHVIYKNDQVKIDEQNKVHVIDKNDQVIEDKKAKHIGLLCIVHNMCIACHWCCPSCHPTNRSKTMGEKTNTQPKCLSENLCFLKV